MRPPLRQFFERAIGRTSGIGSTRTLARGAQFVNRSVGHLHYELDGRF